MTRLDLTGLETRPSQVWGAVRLVPLVRREPLHDLRLHPKLYGESIGIVSVAPRELYCSYVPHGFVATWTGDGTPAAAYGTQLTAGDGTAPAATLGLRFHHRMAARRGRDRLRFLPLHLALEGYLALHFGGPTIAWEEWSRQALRRGLSPRAEEAYAGEEVRGLAEALGRFEMHPGQCGLLVYAGDSLAAAFAVPHPDDYRALHGTLVHDLYGELIHHYATLMQPVPDFQARVTDHRVRSLADLRVEVDEQEHAWARFHDTSMAAGLLEQQSTWSRVYRMGRFTLSRFLPPFRAKHENHIGEAITDDSGRIAYLKTFRLSENQVRRGRLLNRLAANDWRLADTAAEMNVDEDGLCRKLTSAGFGFLVRQDIRDAYRAARRRSGKG